MQLHPEALTSAARLCERQAEHGDATARYVATVCTRPEAFRGVLTLFRGSYLAALGAAGDGLHSSARLARELARGLEAFRDEVVGTDETVHARLDRRQRSLLALPPVVPGVAASLGEIGASPRGWAAAGPPVDGLGWDDYAHEGRDAALGDAPGSRRLPRSLDEHADDLRLARDARGLDEAYDRGRAAAAAQGSWPHQAHDAGAAERAAWQRRRLLDEEGLAGLASTTGTWDDLGERLDHAQRRLDQIGAGVAATGEAVDTVHAAAAFAAGSAETASDVLVDAERWGTR